MNKGFLSVYSVQCTVYKSFTLVKFIPTVFFFFFFRHAACGSLSRDQTQTPYIGSKES